MERAAKKALVTSLHDVFKDTGVVVVAHNTGMVAAQSAEFRKRVKEAGGSVKVAKNKLVQLALKDTDAEGISNLMKGPTILADLPSLDELRAKLIGLLNAPATKIARTIKEPGAKLARVVQAKASKDEAA